MIKKKLFSIVIASSIASFGVDVRGASVFKGACARLVQKGQLIVLKNRRFLDMLFKQRVGISILAGFAYVSAGAFLPHPDKWASDWPWGLLLTSILSYGCKLFIYDMSLFEQGIMLGSGALTYWWIGRIARVYRYGEIYRDEFDEIYRDESYERYRGEFDRMYRDELDRMYRDALDRIYRGVRSSIPHQVQQRTTVVVLPINGVV